MSDEACPYCGAEYDLIEHWIACGRSSYFHLLCNECGQTFVVMVEMRPEFTTAKLDDPKLGEKT